MEEHTSTGDDNRWRQMRELAMSQVLLMAEEHARLSGNPSKCSVVHMIAPRHYPWCYISIPPVRLDEEYYQTGEIIWKVATSVTPGIKIDKHSN